MPMLGGAPPCEACGERVYYNDQKSFMKKDWHKKCFKCAGCHRVMTDTGMANILEENTLVCNQCWRKISSEAGAGPKQEYVNKTDPKCCPRCGKTVYFAEEKLFLSRKWHKACFSCALCHTKVDSRSAADHEGELYCKSCHGRNFGPKGYGFAGGAGTMLSMDNGETNGSEKKEPSSPRQEYVNKEDPDCCPRCGKRVYFAEQMLALGRKYHKLCFNCGNCHKKVDSTSAADHDGELYCRPCYNKQFGPKGYGYACGAGTMLSMDTGKRNVVSRQNVPHTVEAYVAPVTDKMGELDVNGGKANGNGERSRWSSGGDTCRRCDKVVYAAEKKMGAGQSYHTLCFTCHACHKKLDSSNLAEKDQEIYCKNCYGKNFGPKGYGFGGGAGILQTN